MSKLSALLFPKQAAKYSKSVPGQLRVGGIEITNLEALGGDKPGITKVGRLSLSGFVGEKKVKVYTAHSVEHAELLQHLHSLKYEGCQLAPLVATEGRLVVEAWVSGEPVASLSGTTLQSSVAQVSVFLGALEDSPIDLNQLGEGADEFCYLQDYLISRLSEWRHHREISCFLDSWLEDYWALKPSLTKRISHPDLSARNLILESGSGVVRIIDNELLGFGHGWILDWQNSLLSKVGPKELTVDCGAPQEFIEKTWRLRQLGSALDEGRFDKVNRLLLDA